MPTEDFRVGAGTGVNLEFWGPSRYGDLGILLSKSSRPRG